MNWDLAHLWPALAGIISAVGTIVIARWQEQGKNQVFMTQKVDEIVDERVSELKAERDRLQAEIERFYEIREKLTEQLIQNRERIKSLENNYHELQLQRNQAMTRMRHEITEYGRRYTILLTENTQFRLQLGMEPHPWAEKQQQRKGRE